MAKASRRPKHTQNPNPQKIAKHSNDPEGYQGQFIGWHFQCMDSGGKWACDCTIIIAFMNLLCEYEKMKWHEALQVKQNHPMPVEKIDKTAQRRIDDLGYGAAANLYQLKIKGGSGKQRLWGFRRENIFQILWWDPQHTVYPMKY